MITRRQKGTTTVEFAIVAAVVLTMIFGVLEIGRGYYVDAMLDDVARRGARLAAVCPINDPAIAQMAIYNDSGNASDSPLVNGLTPGHVVIDYLDDNNGVVTTPTDPIQFGEIRYVRARVIDYSHTIIAPFVGGGTSIQMPEFVSILPRESLGIPREGAVTPC
jgi:Flp pilus assembly protein TadG